MNTNHAALQWIVNGTQVYDEHDQLLCLVPARRTDAYEVARRLAVTPDLLEICELVEPLVQRYMPVAHRDLIKAIDKAEGRA